MTFAKSYPAISCASASTADPRTTAEAVCPRSAASFCPAAIASSDVLFNVPALCSMKTRIPLLMIVQLCSTNFSLSLLLLNYPGFSAQFLGQFNCPLFRVTTTEQLRLFCFLRQINLLDPLMGWLAGDVGGRGHFLYLFLFGRHDAL